MSKLFIFNGVYSSGASLEWPKSTKASSGGLGQPSPVARAWAIARLRRLGEQLTEESIQRVLHSQGSNAKRMAVRPAESSTPVFKPEATPTPAARAWAEARRRPTDETIPENLKLLWSGKLPVIPVPIVRTAPEASVHSEPPEILAPEPLISSEIPPAHLFESVAPPEKSPAQNPAAPEPLPEPQSRLWEQQVQSLRSTLDYHRSALEESRQQELAMRKMIDSLVEQVRSTNSLESELTMLSQELERSQNLVRDLTNRVEERRIDEVLQEAERTHLAEQRTLLREAEAREKSYLTKISQLEARLAHLSEDVSEVASVEDSTSELRTTIGILETKLAAATGEVTQLRGHLDSLLEEKARLTRALEESRQERESKPSGEAEKLRQEVADLRARLANLTGFQNDPGLGKRKILVETLENELTRCLQRKAELAKRLHEVASSLPTTAETLPHTTEGGRLQISLAFLQERIEAFQDLIAESLAFLRGKSLAEQ